jgi:hypothetical protein
VNRQTNNLPCTPETDIVMAAAGLARKIPAALRRRDLVAG